MKEAKFKNAFILSGGGTRLMIYLGMYAALEELSMKPDVIIGTCGGAIASTVINTFPDHDSRKEYLKSKEYYQFITKERLTKEKRLSRIGVLSLKKAFDKRNAPFIEDVFNSYIAELPQELSEDLPSLKNTIFSKEVPTLIIGSKMLFEPERVGEKRSDTKLYKKVIFSDVETSKKIDVDKIVITSENYKNSAVANDIIIDTDTSMLKSTRISVSDMFYVPPVSSEGTFFAGGAIDLIPIELAKYIANNVTVEKKQAYTVVEEALVRSVLGYSGNQRFLEVQKNNPAYQIDTRNIKKELEGCYIQKKINWKKFEVAFKYPKSYQQYREDLDKQWEYGYQQTLKSIKK